MHEKVVRAQAHEANKHRHTTAPRQQQLMARTHEDRQQTQKRDHDWCIQQQSTASTTSPTISGSFSAHPAPKSAQTTVRDAAKNCTVAYHTRSHAMRFCIGSLYSLYPCCSVQLWAHHQISLQAQFCHESLARHASRTCHKSLWHPQHSGHRHVRNTHVTVCMLPRSSQNRIFRVMDLAMLSCR